MPRAAWLALCSSSIADEMTRPNEMPVTPCSTMRMMISTKEPSLCICGAKGGSKTELGE